MGDTTATITSTGTVLAEAVLFTVEAEDFMEWEPVTEAVVGMAEAIASRHYFKCTS